MIPAVDSGESYDLGYADGYAAARGEIVSGITQRAAAAERAAMTATTSHIRNTSARVAVFLRGLADEARRGEL